VSEPGYVLDFARALERANAFVSPRALRRYQRDLVETGRLQLLSPFDSRPALVTACHVANLGDPAHGNLGVAYRLGGGKPLWLLSSSVKDGFPLSEAYLPLEDRSIWSLDDSLTAQHGVWRAELRRLEDEIHEWPSAPGGAMVTVLLGHPNFAHHLWNELPALDACLAALSRTDRSLPRVLAIYEPLFPLHRLAPESTLQVERVKELAGLTGLRRSLVTRLGSTQVPVALREKVVTILAQTVEGRGSLESDREKLASCSPVFWLSVRLDARTADNQEAFLLSLVTAMAAQYPDSGFIFDGFSYPADFGGEIYRQGVPEHGSGTVYDLQGFLGGAMCERANSVTTAIEGLLVQLGRKCVNPMVNVSCRDLPEAITLAGRADYYVCHTGSLQHKIAWLHDSPGIVHANQAGLEPGAALWLADQLENGRAPALVSSKLIEDLDSIRLPNQVERNRDYRFIDIPGVVAEILADIHRTPGVG
jgi:hypothetical protein